MPAGSGFTDLVTAVTVSPEGLARMDFRILGPLEVADNGREPVIPPGKQRALLGILLLHANEVVSSDRLIEELWGGEAPASAAKSLQVHISRLRRALTGEHGNSADNVVVTLGGGYLIRVAPGALDCERFEALVEQGAQELVDGAPARALTSLEEALALWRGPPLADFAYESFAQPEIARLDELRLAALELRIEAELALGRTAQAIPKLESLVGQHPFRERLRGLLMLALYRSGRQADALEAYQQARGALVDELGIEPGEPLRELERAILAQDPAIDAPAVIHEPAQRPGRAAEAVAPPRRRLRRAAVALGVLVAAGAIAAVVLLAAPDDGTVVPLTDDSHAVAVIDPATNEVTTVASVGTNPGPIAYEPRSHSLWVGNLDDESVSRIDVRPVRTGRTIPLGQRPLGLAAGAGSVWVAGASRTRPFVTARRIDPRFDTGGERVKVQSLPEGEASIALSRRSLWVAPSFGLLTRLDPISGAVTGPRLQADYSPTTVAADGRAVWVADRFANIVSRIEPRTLVPQAIPVAGGPADIALGKRAAWVSAALDDSVARIDLGTGLVRGTTPVGRRPAGVAVGAGAVWVANSGDGTVSRLDPASGRLTHTIPVGGSPQDVVVGDGRVWVSVRPRRTTGEEVQGGTVRVETPGDVDFLDPALSYEPLSFEIQYATCAKLVNYPDESGPAGTRLTPELAESLPRPTAGGRTYTFRIRKGFRFSPPSGEPVTAQTLKYSIERSMHPKMRSPAAGFLSDVVGAEAYAAGSAKHISGITAAGDTLTIRLTRPSSNLLFQLSVSFFCAVPDGTPIDPEGLRKVPSAGPYYVAAHSPGEQIVLRRNPYYRGPRPQRPKQIRITVGAGTTGTIARVEKGAVDYAAFIGGPETVRRLQARYGPASEEARRGRQRYFATMSLQLSHIAFNTSRGVFRSGRLRRAVNYALDRRALSREGLFTDLPGRPTDQYLPPDMPGYRDARIYPLTPDLQRARELAGSKRRRVVLYAFNEPAHLRFAEIVKANLRRIGMDVEIRASGSHFERIGRRGEPFDMAVSGWQSDYPDPLDFLHQLDSRTIGPTLNVNSAYFDDPGYDRRLDAAARLASPARELALGRLADDVARTSAPWAAIANDQYRSFFSARMGCQVRNPLLGVDLAALCIRD